MTSDEIKATQDYKESWVAEIAYQLAKLNEHFEMVDGAVFGGVNEKGKKEKI